MNDVLDRAGHLSELALDVHRFDGPRADVAEHLAACAACREALAALEAEDGSARVPAPSAAKVAPIGRRGRGWARWAGGGAVLLAAALVFVVTRPAAVSDGDGLRIKSGGFDFEVFVHDGQRSRAVIDGDTVHPGERMGFRVRVREAGYLLVIGRDDQGHTYPCYPSGDVGAVAAQAFPETPEPQVLPVAMRFDDILGSEHIVAMLCPAPIAAADVGPDARGAEGCVTHALTLHKRARGEPGPTPGEDGTPR